MLTYVILFLIFMPVILWIIAIPIGTVKYIIDNKPTQAHTSPPDAWETYDAYIAEEHKKAREKDYYTALIANLEDVQRIIENKERDEKQLRQLITLDKQIHAAQLKLEKLG